MTCLVMLTVLLSTEALSNYHRMATPCHLFIQYTQSLHVDWMIYAWYVAEVCTLWYVAGVLTFINSVKYRHQQTKSAANYSFSFCTRPYIYQMEEFETGDDTGGRRLADCHWIGSYYRKLCQL